MESPLDEKVIIQNMEEITGNPICLNEKNFYRTLETSKLVLPKLKSVVNNDAIINFVADRNKSLVNKEKPPQSSSVNVQPLHSDIDAVLHIGSQAANDEEQIFSSETLEPNANELEVEEEGSNIHNEASTPLYFRFQFKKTLHEIVNPINKFKYKCHICKGRYIYKFSLKRHFVRNHVSVDYISNADLANCKVPVQDEKAIPQFVEKSKTSGRNRYSLPEGSSYFIPDEETRISGLYKCHLCPGLKFDIEKDLLEHYSSHLNTKHTDDIFTCGLCSVQFDKKKDLDEHINDSHTTKKFNFYCRKCPQKFEEITNFTYHLQSHKGGGRNCKYCEKKFSTPANRKRHENIHERGRVFPCLYCKTKFSQSHELEKHVKKIHSNLKFSCPHCPPANNETFTSQSILEDHIASKHCNIPSKKTVTSNKPKVYKTIGRKLSKECFCCFCKKKFSSVKAMVTHKNLIHKNEIAQLKNKKFSGKELVKEKSQGDFMGSRKIKTVPSKQKGAREKNSSKVDDSSRKTGIYDKKRTTYERKAKSSYQFKLSKDKTYRKKDEAEKKFYLNISSNVADNLMNYVDGGPDQINLKVSSFDDQNDSFDYRPNTIEVPWSAHNFSSYFDFGNAVSRRKEMSQLFPEEQCLYATGLERNISSEDILNLSSQNSSTPEKTVHSGRQESHLETKEEKDKCINQDICVVYLCNVCKGTVSNYLALEDHFVNNHPNVEISAVGLEAPGKSPPAIPGELRRLPYSQPNGILSSCEGAQTTREQSDFKCTKCAARFNHLNDLYTHIFKCATGARDIRFRRKVKNRCYRRNKFQTKKYFSIMQGNERDQRQLPLPSKLRPISCPYNCTSVFISNQALQEHKFICIYRFKNDDTKSKKKGNIRKKKNDQSPELSPSPIPINENGGSSEAVKNSFVGNKDSSPLNCYKDNVLSNEPLVVTSSSQLTLPTANHSLTASLKSILEVSRTKESSSDLSCEKTVVLEKDDLKTSGPSFEVLRNLVRAAKSKLFEDLPVDGVNESCVKRKETIPQNFIGKNMEKSADICLAENSKRNISTKSGHNNKSVNISEQFTVQTKETSPGLGNNNIPKIKEVVKEMQLAASSLPTFKKSNTPLTFLSSEINQNREYSSKNNNSPVQIGLNSLSEKKSGATNESQPSEKARQRKKRKPVKIMQKMTNETDNNHINLPPFSNKAIDCLTPFTGENNSFKPIENSGEKMHSLDSEIPKLPDLVPEKDKIDFPNANEKCNADDQGLSTTVFLPEVKPTSSGDRDSPSLEMLVSSVTQNIENFDKPSLLDDEKFALQAPDLIIPTPTKSTDMSTNNGLNFKIRIPTGESPSKSQVSDKDALDYLTTEKAVDEPTNESSLHVSSDKNNVKESVINKMKSILNASDNVNAMKRKELIDNQVKNVHPSAKNSVPVNNNILALTSHPSNSSATNSTTTSLESVSPEFQRSHSSTEDGKGLNEKELTVKLISTEKRGKKGADSNKGEGNKKGKEDNTSDSKKASQGQLVMAEEIDIINLVPGQKSKLKEKVKSRMIEVDQSASNEIAQTELQKKKGNSKLSVDKNCDSINKDIPLKLPAENHKRRLALETNHQLTDKNEDCEGISSASENSANLRFLRMKRPAPDDGFNQNANKNARPSNSSKIDILHHQTSEREEMLSNSRIAATLNISETASRVAAAVLNRLESVTQAPLPVSKDESNCKNNSKSLDDLNSPELDRDVLVKKEKPDNEPVRQRSCPYCYLDFAYLTNFKRHLLKCPSRPENDASEVPVITNSAQFQHLPKKNEVEESMLNLLRHQSRQNQLIRNPQKTEDSKAKSSFQKYSCPECHKIYFSYWVFMRHKVTSHKMTNQDVPTTESDGPLTFQDMHLEESNMHQEIRTADLYEPSTSQGLQIAPVEENGYENNVQMSKGCNSDFTASDVPSESNANGKNSTSIVDSCVKETTQVNAYNRERNSFSDFTHDGLKLDNKSIATGSIPNAAECFGNVDSLGDSISTEKTKTIDLSSDGRKVSAAPSDKEQPNPSLLTLPAYGKGRGRKKKGVPENLTEKKMTDMQSNIAEDISSGNEPKAVNSLSKKEPAINNPLLKTVEKPDLSDLKPSPKNTLVNKLRNTLSKSMQIGNNLNSSVLKSGKKSEARNADTTNVKLIEKDLSSFKSPIKKNPMENSKLTDKTGVPGSSQQLNVSRRGRKKSNTDRVSLKQSPGSFKQECIGENAQVTVPSDANDSSVEVTETGMNSRLQDISKANKLKSLRNQSHPGPGSSTVSDDKKSLIKKSITNAFQSCKVVTKPVKSSKTSLQEVSSPDAQSSQKSSAVCNKVKSPRGTKANCDNEPIPSTSYGPIRGRKPRPVAISLDLSSELEDAEDFQQRKPKQKKKPNNKVCPICKQKFPTLLQKNRHLQLVHGRKRSRNEGPVSPTLVPAKKETVAKVADIPAIVPDRSSYQRQCSKPLPPMKRKYEKVGVRNFQPEKKRRF